MNMDIVGSRRSGPQLSTRHDDDDDENGLRSSSNRCSVAATDITGCDQQAFNDITVWSQQLASNIY